MIALRCISFNWQVQEQRNYTRNFRRFERSVENSEAKRELRCMMRFIFASERSRTGKAGE